MDNSLRILVIEDNPDLAANLIDYLTARGHVVDAAGDGQIGLHLATTCDFDVILLDLILPRLDGISLCRRLREDAGKTTPVLMLTARDSLEDKIAGLEAGADDYLVKPFALREVAARVRALARRAGSAPSQGTPDGGRPGFRHGHLPRGARRHGASTCRRFPCACWKP